MTEMEIDQKKKIKKHKQGKKMKIDQKKKRIKIAKNEMDQKKKAKTEVDEKLK